MAWIRAVSLTGVALLIVVASSVKAASPSFDNHGDIKHHPSIVVEAANYENLALPMPETLVYQGLVKQHFQKANVEDRKFFRPHYFLYPYILSHPNHPLNNPYPELAETPETVELADDEIPIAEKAAEVAQNDDNEETPETNEIPESYKNEPEAQLDEEEVEVADRKQEDVLALDNDEENVIQ